MASAMHVRVETFAVRSFEVDAFETLSAPALAGYLQEVAALHAEEMGCGMAALGARGLTWVLFRQRIEISAPARRGDVLEISSWPSGLERIAALRDFEVRRTGGPPISRAATQWLVVDVARRRPVRPDRALAEPFRGNGRRVFADFGADLPAPRAWEGERRFEVRYQDIDRNLHVTNTSYLSWALESVPREIWQSSRVASLEAHYLAESRHGSVVLSRLARSGEREFLHAIFREQDGKELARLRTAWVQREGA
jgi:acyl-ACP thioesterase